MKAFNKLFALTALMIILLIGAANLFLLSDSNNSDNRHYRVEINRIAAEIREKGFDSISLDSCQYVTAVVKYGENFYNSSTEYAVREINGELYRFDYSKNDNGKAGVLVTVNVILGITALFIFALMLYIRINILKPFEQLSEIPYQLSKGNLTLPLKETKNRFFGRFVWGINMLRESIEDQKNKELDLEKSKKTLLLSLSHDIKTPLTAIKLYSQALSKGLYQSVEKQAEISQSINAKADEIEGYISQIITASKEDFISFEVNSEEFYVKDLADKIKEYYGEKLALLGTDFVVSNYDNCLISGDFNRSVEVLQNIMENALKYGDGKAVEIDFSGEEDCILITVANSGCTLDQGELPHIFESFWRGANAKNKKGSGLGLYISRRLMQQMKGEVFAKIENGFMRVTVVFNKA